MVAYPVDGVAGQVDLADGGRRQGIDVALGAAAQVGNGDGNVVHIQQQRASRTLDQAG
ncbi:hypothetical protein D3C83_312020 [compost metagenome]